MTSEQIQIRQLMEEDLLTAASLSQLAGWNQTPGDWQRILCYEPEGCFCAVVEGQPVGTVTTTTYGTRLGWIGMMLVHPNFRRRGIATELMRRGMGYLQEKGVRCLKLDATPEGCPVYERLGFHAEWDFSRWERPGPEESPLPVSSSPFPFPGELDQQAFGADRSLWIRAVSADSYFVTLEEGYGMIRHGRLADYLGPVVAKDARRAREIVVELLAASSRRIFWDIPGPNQAAAAMARDLGFEPVRSLLRMWTGEQLVSGLPEYQYGLVDPATG